MVHYLIGNTVSNLCMTLCINILRDTHTPASGSGEKVRSMPSRLIAHRASRQPAMLLQASVTLVVLFECATAFVPVGVRLPLSSLNHRAVDRIQSQKARTPYYDMARLARIRMSPDMLQAEPEGSVEMELASPPSLSGPPVRPVAPAPEEEKKEPVAAAPAPVAPPPAVEKEAPAPAPPAVPEKWKYPEEFSWVKEEKGVTPSDVHITQCGKCRAQYAINLDQLGDEGKKVQCAVCSHVWFQSPRNVEELPAGIEFKQYPMEDYKEHARQVAERKADGGGGGGGGGGGRRSGACTLFVGNLPFSLTEDTLRNVFSPYGNVLSASIICDQETGKPRGFGFVDFDDIEDGKEAMEMVNGMTVEGRQLAVNLSEDKGGGGGRGGRGGGRGDRGGGRGRGRGGGAPRGRSDGRDANGKFIIRKRGQ